MKSAGKKKKQTLRTSLLSDKVINLNEWRKTI